MQWQFKKIIPYKLLKNKKAFKNINEGFKIFLCCYNDQFIFFVPENKILHYSF